MVEVARLEPAGLRKHDGVGLNLDVKAFQVLLDGEVGVVQAFEG